MEFIPRLVVSLSIGIIGWILIYSVIDVKKTKNNENTKKSNSKKEEDSEKEENIEVECKICGIKFNVTMNKSYYVFNCPRCKTIFESEISNNIRRVKVVRKGKIIPKEFEKEIKILDLKEEIIDQEKLNIAWKKKIELYHPDKVSHLAKEIQELAEEKTKELNAAYDKIKNWILENKY